jgi:hypothetical protein
MPSRPVAMSASVPGSGTAVARADSENRSTSKALLLICPGN